MQAELGRPEPTHRRLCPWRSAPCPGACTPLLSNGRDGSPPPPLMCGEVGGVMTQHAWRRPRPRRTRYVRATHWARRPQGRTHWTSLATGAGYVLATMATRPSRGWGWARHHLAVVGTVLGDALAPLAAAAWRGSALAWWRPRRRGLPTTLRGQPPLTRQRRASMANAGGGARRPPPCVRQACAGYPRRPWDGVAATSHRDVAAPPFLALATATERRGRDGSGHPRRHTLPHRHLVDGAGRHTTYASAGGWGGRGGGRAGGRSATSGTAAVAAAQAAGAEGGHRGGKKAPRHGRQGQRHVHVAIMAGGARPCCGAPR